ncbi:hypothetical protein FA95DRAFT_562627 [Auriscalpium vulgare]|uniref:Uncharacterized protein n=1 Tax=Auriscalpium vulgare TaxID=40419 RepID=A0ACB8RF10_9AGAM|nr:hypothetical protein FA95DRAFT_562627 [Auriscalpium vulgare]
MRADAPRHNPHHPSIFVSASPQHPGGRRCTRLMQPRRERLQVNRDLRDKRTLRRARKQASPPRHSARRYPSTRTSACNSLGTTLPASHGNRVKTRRKSSSQASMPVPSPCQPSLDANYNAISHDLAGRLAAQSTKLPHISSLTASRKLNVG